MQTADTRGYSRKTRVHVYFEECIMQSKHVAFYANGKIVFFFLLDRFVCRHSVVCTVYSVHVNLTIKEIIAGTLFELTVCRLLLYYHRQTHHNNGECVD